MKQRNKLICILLAAALCLGLAACGGEPTAAPEATTAATGLGDFLGTWKYDNYDTICAINADGTWEMFALDGTSAGSSVYEYADGVVTLMDGNGDPSISLASNGDGTLTDSDGDTLSSYAMEGVETTKFVPTDLDPELPSPQDPLTQTIDFADCPGVSISYPALMEGHPVDGEYRLLSFNAINEVGTDDYYTNITVLLQNITGYDQYMTQGRDSAEKWMNIMLANGVESMCGDSLIKYIGCDFVDGGTYWGITGYAWMDGSFFKDPIDQPVRSTIEMRYVGETGYAVIVMATAVESRINNYYGIACNMIDSITVPGGFSTSPKTVPSAAGRPADGSDPGDYGTPYYWYDGDGDVWYWNGYENEFIGFGDDYYIEDGEYYESNDAGWDYDDYYYYDDYDPWSDAGDGDDFWSDPGDYDYYWDDGDYYNYG